jgi:response regulator NasT
VIAGEGNRGGDEASEFSGAFLYLEKKSFGEEEEKRMTNQALATVLTADDDPAARGHLRLVLEDAGFAILADAADGEQAVALARTHSPDVIVLDLGLPVLDGAAAAKAIRAERDVPIVALTGERHDELVARAAAAGVAAYVAKRFVERDLVDAVAEAVARPARLPAAREQSRRALAATLELLGYPDPAWAAELEERSFARGKVWRLGPTRAEREPA